MYLPRLFNSLNVSMQEQCITELLELNEKTKEYGLILTPQDVELMMAARNQVLYSYGRVELSIEVTKALIEVFSASSFINQENYADTLNELHEIFYYLKNETEDKISDMKLLHRMKEVFEEDCEGSLDLLKSRLEEYAEEFRRDLQKNDSLFEGEDEYWDLNI
ncbi:hypothetical protein SAMN04487895_12213 [Paenibacillus sophorae]|uniref:Uncharacterized protein n=1 Tax=Paenibacillus sophorae TaxID=1333845 RepID=A0A1H8V8Q9_9BACL|nr:DUF6323 family protein [Paenibacillus sophorae]QWU13252.1 hypothetical protein KP014_14620 [Paenibacillus sophorae]SEP11653.1 hypothetical protein SAMN04487895_12213 [Paenibacillus sophorae]